MTKITQHEPIRAMSHDDVRCGCGQLVARWGVQAIEIKCKRCRRVVKVAFGAIEGVPPSALAP